MFPEPSGALASFPMVAVLLALASLGWAAAHDVAARTIPDGASVALALLGGTLRAGEGWDSLLPSLLAAAAVLLAGLLLAVRGLFGGGDAKLLASASLLVPVAAVPALAADVALAGGALAILYLLLARLLRSHRAGGPPPLAPRAAALRRVGAVEWRRIRRRGPLPYGVAIAAGVALALTGRGA